MATAAHSPTPWTKSNRDKFINDATGRRVCIVYLQGKNAEQLEADRSLIAAAPEIKTQRDALLAACNLVSKAHGHTEPGSCGETLWLQRIRSAITEATS